MTTNLVSFRFDGFNVKARGACRAVMFTILTAMAAVTLAPLSLRAAFTAVGAYDPTSGSATATNNVDFNAPFSSATGDAAIFNSTLQMFASTGNGAAYAVTNSWNAACASTFAAGRGGVVDFETGTLDAGSRSLTVNLGGGNTVQLSLPAGGTDTMNLSSSLANRTPISGTNYIGKNAPASFAFTVGAVLGSADPDERVRAIGATILGRSDNSATWTVTVVYTNSDTAGGSGGTVVLQRSHGTGNTTQDTFYGGAAPAGYWIVAFNLISSGNFTGLDDLAVLTQPQPIARSLTWQGGLNANAWDVGTTANWLVGAAPAAFANGDLTSFTDAGAGPLVNLVGALSPRTVNVTAANAYTFQGAGKLTGSAGLVKDGTGTLTLATTNDYSGTTTISNGLLRLNAPLPPGNVFIAGLADGTRSALLGLTAASGDFTNASGAGPRQVTTGASTGFAGGFAAYGGDRSVNFGGAGATQTFSTGGGFFGGGFVLSAPDSDSTITLINPLNLNNATRTFLVQDGLPAVDAVAAGAFTQGGAGGVVYKRGTGTLALTGNTTVPLPFNISEGVLQIGVGGTNGHPGTGELQTYATLTFNRSDTLVLSNILSQGGTVRQVGSGTTFLMGASSFSGTSFVDNGKLVAATGSSGSSYTVADGKTLGVKVLSPGMSLYANSLILGSTTGCTLDFDAGSFGNPSAPLLSAMSDLNATGTITVNLAGSGFTTGTFTLIQYFGNSTGTRTIVVGTMNPLLTGVTINDDTVNKVVTLTIGGVAEQALVWTGAVSANWDANNAPNLSWKGSALGLPAYYQQNAYGANDVLFNDDATGSTNLSVLGTLTPQSVAANNNAKDYTLGGSGKISGATGLTKDGSATLTIATTNDYSGDTTVNSGTLKLGASEVIPDGAGKGTFNLNFGTLDVAGQAETLNGLAGSGTVDNSAGNGVLAIGANSLDIAFGGTLQNTAGTLKLGKLGTGTMTIATANTYSGGTEIIAGKINAQAAGAVGTGPVTIQTNKASNNQLILGAADLSLTNPLTLNGGGAVGQGALHYNQTYGSATYAGPITIAGPTQAGGHFGSAAGGELIVAGKITGLTNVTSRTGNITLSNSANSFAQFRIAEGTLKPAVVGAIPTNVAVVVGDTGNASAITIFDLNGLNQELAGLTRNASGSGSVAKVSNSAPATATLTLNIAAGTTNTYNGSIEGDILLVKRGAGLAVQTAPTTFTNLTVVAEGTLRLNGGNPQVGCLDGTSLIVLSNGTTLDLQGDNSISGWGGGPRDLAVNGGTVNFNSGNHQVAALMLNGGDLQSSATPNIYGSIGLNSNVAVTANSTLSALNVDLNDAVRAFDVTAGQSLDVTGYFKSYSGQYATNFSTNAGILKLGGGTMSLGTNGVQGYYGPTTVSNGTLLVNGLLPNSAVTVFGGTLGGNGTIGQPVVISAGATIAPGASIGTLTINDALTLASGSTTLVEVSAAAGTHDAVLGLTSVSYAGTLVVSNLAGTLAAGQTFALFSAAAATGNFDAIVPAAPGANLAWQFNPTNGVLSVLSTLPPSPPLSFTYSGGNLQLSWPAAQTGWIVQSNAVSLTTPAAWHDVPGSGASNSLNIPVNPALTNVFYRLREP